MATLNGCAAVNKGMALFPRRINGRYAMVSRQDHENLFLMYSDNIHFWNEIIPLMKPSYPWNSCRLGPAVHRLKPKRLASSYSWCWTFSAIFYWRHSSRQRKSIENTWSFERAAHYLDREYSIRLRSERCVHLRGAPSQRQAYCSLCNIRPTDYHFLDFTL